jgi:methyl-accepting chemotaxis protein
MTGAALERPAQDCIVTLWSTGSVDWRCNVNFDDAIQAHAAWKIKLAVYLKRPDGTINSADLGSDNRCPLGQWLHGDAKKNHSSLAEYQTLMTEHARFHRVAGRIADQANSGVRMNTEAVLGGGGEFATASLNVVKAVRNLKAKVE